MNRRNFLKSCSVSVGIGVGLPQLSAAKGNNIDSLQLQVEEQNTIHQLNQLTRFRALGDECLDNFIEEISFSGNMVVTSLDGSHGYAPKVVVTDRSLKTAFDQQESIEGLDYIFDDISIPLDEKQIKKQFYFSNMTFLPIEMADPYKVNRMLRMLEIIKGIRTQVLKPQVIIIAILPFPWEDQVKHKISHQAINRIKTIDVGYILIPSNTTRENKTHDEAKLNINNLVVQSVRAPTELVTCMGLPSGTSCVVDPILSTRGKTTIGIGSDSGKDRAVEATMTALKSLSFDLIGLTKSNGVLVNITTGSDYSLEEWDKVSNIIGNFIPSEFTSEIAVFSEMAVFSVIKPEIYKRMDVTIIATGSMK